MSRKKPVAIPSVNLSVKTIPLTQGYESLVDEEDYARVSQFKWHAQVDRRKDGTIKNVYAVRNVCLDGKWVGQKLHRFIMEKELAEKNDDSDLQIDHRDGCTTNNTRNNLRIVNQSQNNANRRKRSNRISSVFKGVWWEKHGQKWRAGIRVCGKMRHLGLFTDEIAAARAYDAAALKHFGEYALLNFPVASSAKVVAA
jgi:HNH endonuclease